MIHNTISATGVVLDGASLNPSVRPDELSARTPGAVSDAATDVPVFKDRESTASEFLNIPSKSLKVRRVTESSDSNAYNTPHFTVYDADKNIKATSAVKGLRLLPNQDKIYLLTSNDEGTAQIIETSSVPEI